MQFLKKMEMQHRKHTHPDPGSNKDKPLEGSFQVRNHMQVCTQSMHTSVVQEPRPPKDNLRTSCIYSGC